ncbi:MAG: metal ABC transporter permease [Patescibacteria group bacterium]
MFEIFQFEFMIRAFIIGIFLSVLAPVLGLFLVVRRYPGLADTLAHVSLAGVVLGFLLKIPPLLASIGTTFLAAIGMEAVRRKKIFGESVQVLFLSGGLAIATVLLRFDQGNRQEIFSFFFGSIATVSWQDVWITLITAVFALTIISLFYRTFFLVALDEDLAQAQGVRIHFWNFLFVALAALTVSVVMRVVGILLVGSLMIIPVLAALQFGYGFFRTMMIAIGISLFSVIAGLFFSYYIDLATGGAIVLIALSCFFGSFLYKHSS